MSNFGSAVFLTEAEELKLAIDKGKKAAEEQKIAADRGKRKAEEAEEPKLAADKGLRMLRNHPLWCIMSLSVLKA